ncbi:MAG: c-type cytochrome [Planctomycetaceae bacterium]
MSLAEDSLRTSHRDRPGFSGGGPERRLGAKRWRVLGLALLVLWVVGLWVVGEAGWASPVLAEDATAGQQLYVKVCLSCHGRQGEGGAIADGRWRGICRWVNWPA